MVQVGCNTLGKWFNVTRVGGDSLLLECENLGKWFDVKGVGTELPASGVQDPV